MKTNHPLGFQHIRGRELSAISDHQQIDKTSPRKQYVLHILTLNSHILLPHLAVSVFTWKRLPPTINTPYWYPTAQLGLRDTAAHNITRDIGHIINKFDLILITLIIKYDTSIKCNRYSRSQQLNAHLLSSKNNRLLQIYPCHSLKLKLKLNGIVEKPCWNTNSYMKLYKLYIACLAWLQVAATGQHERARKSTPGGPLVTARTWRHRQGTNLR